MHATAKHIAKIQILFDFSKTHTLPYLFPAMYRQNHEIIFPKIRFPEKHYPNKVVM